MPSHAGVVVDAEPVRRRLDPQPVIAYVESLVGTAIAPILGYSVDRTDPFLLKHNFCWIALAPALIALRHGFALGFVSAMVLDVSVALFWRAQARQGVGFPFPTEVIVGMVVLTIIAGQFSDVFRRDVSQLRRGLRTARRRLDALSRAHFLLELSHDRLTQQQGPAAPNLNGAIAAAHKAMTTAGGTGREGFSACAPALVEIYTAYFSVEVASLLAVEQGALVRPVLASVGKVHTVEDGDALLADAMRTKTLTHMPAALARGVRHPQSRLLAAVPFVDTNDTLRGVLAIESLPFIAFERRNLEAMAVLAGHVADLLAQQELPPQRDQGRQNLEVVMERALSDLRDFARPSTLAKVRVPRGSRANDVLDVVLGSALREIDFPYAAYDPATGDLDIYVLLAMSDETVAFAMMDRMARVVQREQGVTLAALGVRVAVHPLRADDTVASALGVVDAA